MMVDFSGDIQIVADTPKININLEGTARSTTDKKPTTNTTTNRNKSSSRRSTKKSILSAMSVVSHDGTNTFLSTKRDSTVAGRSSSHNSNSLSRTNREMEEHDTKARLVVGRLKMAILLFFTLTAVGVATAFFVYRSYNKRTRDNQYRARFREEAENMLASIGANIDSTLGATDAFAMSMLAEADATNQTYPFVTIKNFAVQAGKLLKNSRAKYITTYQNVARDQRREWEAYAKTHNGWVDQSLEVQSRDPGYSGPEITKEFLEEQYLGHYDLIHDYDEAVFGWENSTDGVDHEGPFLPIWQCTPVIPIDPIYNWDLLSNNPNPESSLAAAKTHLVTFREPYLINWPDDIEYQEYNEAEAQWFANYLEEGEEAMAPVFDIYYPLIVDALYDVTHHEPGYSASNRDGYNASEHTLGGYLALSIYWRDMLRDLLPSGSAGVIAVLKNELAPPFAFEITGPVPKYLGVGYFNETGLGDPLLNITTGLLEVWDFAIANSSYTGIPVNDEICKYTIEVYPAQSAYQQFMDNNDNSVYVVLILVLVVSIMTIAFTFLFFFLYDRLVRSEIRSKINLLDAKRNFVRFVSHEVRTPLNTVCMGLTLIHQDFQRREKQLRRRRQSNDSTTTNDESSSLVTRDDFQRWSSLTEEVSNNADVAVGVLNDLLNIDKIQMGAFKLEMEILPIWQIVEQTTNEFTMMAAKQKTNLELDLSSLGNSSDSPTMNSNKGSHNNLVSLGKSLAAKGSHGNLVGLGKSRGSSGNLVGLGKSRGSHGNLVSLGKDPSTSNADDDIEAGNPAKKITRSSMLPKALLHKKLIGDEQRLRQVLRNLLSNALKFSKHGSVTVRVSSVGGQPANTPKSSVKDLKSARLNQKEFRMANGTRRSFASSGRIVIDVVDTGVGMTPLQLQTVFDVGTQFNASKLQSGGGSGLGLAFAKAIAEQHGGSLRAYSDGKDKGTTFRLDLPLHYYDESEVDDSEEIEEVDLLKESARSNNSTMTTSSSSQKRRTPHGRQMSRQGSGPFNDEPLEDDELEPMNILVVDDAPMNRKLLVRLLESNGHTCEQAENGEELIENVRQNMARYDCILVDYEMPVMNGPEACKGVREMGYTGFVVGVTGNLLPEDIGYFMDCGADAVLPKPFKYHDLEALLIEHGMFGLSM